MVESSILMTLVFLRLKISNSKMHWSFWNRPKSYLSLNNLIISSVLSPIVTVLFKITLVSIINSSNYKNLNSIWIWFYKIYKILSKIVKKFQRNLIFFIFPRNRKKRTSKLLPSIASFYFLIIFNLLPSQHNWESMSMLSFWWKSV